MKPAERRGRNAILIAVGLAVIATVGVTLLGGFLRVDTHADMAPERAEREDLMMWLARVLFLLGAIWIAIGAIATRTSLVRRPGAAAARATWLAFSRPWRARESMLGLLALDRWLMIIVPAGMLISTILVLSSFLSPIPVLLSSAGWFVFGFVCIILVWPRSAWPLIAAISGTAIVWCLVVLAGVCIFGPGEYWILLWQTPWLRYLVITVALAVIAWTAIATGGAINAQVGPVAATGVVVAAVGVTAALVGLAVSVLDPVWLGSQWKDDTVHLTLEPWASWVVTGVGVAAFIVGLVFAARGKRQPVPHRRAIDPD